MRMIKNPPFPVGLKTQMKVIYDNPEKNRNRYGRMVYGHKTAGAIEIMTKDCWDNNKKYFEPIGARSCVKNFSKST
jgi:hypothetical protein